MVRSRLAPSPTGHAHLGNARTALLTWLRVRKAGGQLILRIEDLDPPRVVAGAETALVDDLRWLGLDWDEGVAVDGPPPGERGPHGPYHQSARGPLYDAAVERLLSSGDAFLCACSRAEVARAASAPHGPDDEGPRYPGTCANLASAAVEAKARAAGRRPVVRFRGRGRRIAFVDAVCGQVEPLGEAGLDDFVIRRADGVASYQLAVIVDDAAMAIDEVVRADDLLTSTPRQIALAQALALPVPRYAHVPLVLAADGERLAKRNRPRSLAELRAAGTSAGAVVAALAASAGLGDGRREVAPADLIDSFDWSRLRREPVVIPDDPSPG